MPIRPKVNKLGYFFFPVFFQIGYNMHQLHLLLLLYQTELRPDNWKLTSLSFALFKLKPSSRKQKILQIVEVLSKHKKFK